MLEEIGGYVLECRGNLQVKVKTYALKKKNMVRFPKKCPVKLCLHHQGKGDMITYWLLGKTSTSQASKDAKSSKHVTMETKEMEKERYSYSSVPGFLSNDLHLDQSESL